MNFPQTSREFCSNNNIAKNCSCFRKIRRVCLTNIWKDSCIAFFFCYKCMIFMQMTSCDTTTLNWDSRNMHIVKTHNLWTKIFFFLLPENRVLLRSSQGQSFVWWRQSSLFFYFLKYIMIRDFSSVSRRNWKRTNCLKCWHSNKNASLSLMFFMKAEYFD